MADTARAPLLPRGFRLLVRLLCAAGAASLTQEDPAREFG